MFSNVKNLIFLNEDLIEEIKDLRGKEFKLINNSILLRNGEEILKFDVSRIGNAESNAIGVIRDIHNILNPDSQKTRTQVKKTIKFIR